MVGGVNGIRDKWNKFLNNEWFDNIIRKDTMVLG